MPQTLNEIMESASQKLAALDYLACERLCLDALALARAQSDWTYYARVLMPLQECRRQRRMIALDTAIQLGSANGYPQQFNGCLLLSPPHTAEDAERLTHAAKADQLHVQVLLTTSDLNADTWTIKTFQGPDTEIELASPENVALNEPVGPVKSSKASEWFIAASEALGDAAIASADAELGTLERVIQLEERVAAVGDHEKLHQRLSDAARAMSKLTTA